MSASRKPGEKPHKWLNVKKNGKPDYSPGTVCRLCGVKSKYGKDSKFPRAVQFTYPDGRKVKVSTKGYAPACEARRREHITE
jgi:hypothetical protein